MGNVTADRAWDVHPVTEADIEAYLDIYLNSYPAYKTLDRGMPGTLPEQASYGAAGGHPDSDDGPV